MSFEAFMSLALYDPEFGYYTRSSTTIGRGGDFYTSPHLHRIFGVMIGKQMEEMWEIMGRPDRFHIVEMGAGMGHLAKDMLDYISAKELFCHLNYIIVELNPAVCEQQKTLLSDHSGKISWVTGLAAIEKIEGCFLSNELLDALPVHLVVMRETLMEVFVSLPEERDNTRALALEEVERPCNKSIASYLSEFSIFLSEGYKTEINLKIKDWLREVHKKLERGFIATIDYGYSSAEYYSEDRNTGTLLCYHKHQVNENFYQNIGEQDITSHVNFSSVKKWGEELGLRTEGYCPQGTYLVSLGIDKAITEMYGGPADPFPVPESLRLFEMAQIKGLIFPQGMGASHQVMVQSKGIDEVKLRGFMLKNHAGRL